MPLIVSISGIRGVVGDGLSAETLVQYAGAFGAHCREKALKAGRSPIIVVGRDGRSTGEMCSRLVSSTLQMAGCSVIDAGMSTTPTIEMAVGYEKAIGAIIISASHNPAEWNAMKLLDENGEFLSPEEGEAVVARIKTAANNSVPFSAVGEYHAADYLERHVNDILSLDWVNTDNITRRQFRIVVDGINSVGSVAVPYLLNRLGIPESRIKVLNAEPNGRFAHNPEPLPANVQEAMQSVRDFNADIGFVVDPDVDRLALIDENGAFFGEELTQVLATDFVLRRTPGHVATNLSSSRAIEDIAARFGQRVYRSAVGEINVVQKMKRVNAVIGGEGNGGVILPGLHYGRDGLVGITMALQHLADERTTLSAIKADYPVYFISKNKISLENLDFERALTALKKRYSDARISTIDGLKIDLEEGWVHLRRSNTEPILRVYSEANTKDASDALALRFISEIRECAS